MKFTMPNPKRSLLPLILFVCSIMVVLVCAWGEEGLTGKEVKVIGIGVILDLNSSIGSMAQRCISMALQDFYKLNVHYKTRLVPQTHDSKYDVVTAASAAQYLMEIEKVYAIMGPLTSEQARFVIELGSKAKVPILSFSATSPSLSPTQHPYFIRTAHNDRSQLEAIAAIVKAYGWHDIVLVYEDTEYGNGLIPYLNDALVRIDTRVPYKSVIDPNAGEFEISQELHKLNQSLPRIFLVHMTPNLGSKFFLAVKKAGMMTKGYGWIVTQGLSAELSYPMATQVIESMEGVLGVRPFMVKKSKRLEDFKRRWNWNASSIKPTLMGLWAYDTVWALAMAVEKNVTLLSTMLGTKFSGLSGDFSLVKREIEASALEIFNVREGKERVFGNWTPQTGLKLKLEQQKWPGDTAKQPPMLRIGIPVRQGTNDFKKIKNFSFDVFYEVVKVLPFPLSYEFVPFGKNGQTNGTYDNLIMQIKNQEVDAVVGDVTIVANRSNYVDFTLPFSQSEVSMVVSVKHDKWQSMWVFLKPLKLELWLTIGATFISIGFTIWFLEHRSNTEFRGTPRNQLGIIFWFSFSTLVFAHRERIKNNLSRLVLIIWVFVVLIITQSYTASLASILTVQRLQPAFIDIKEIQIKGYCVGYMNRSFVRGLLIEHLGINESKLKGYDSPEDYHQALSLGSNNGGVDAIFDEIFYLNLFLSKYGSRYKMVGEPFKTDGLGFAFPQNSPLVAHFSRAILNVTEDKEKFDRIKKKYFSHEIMPEDQSATMSSDSPSLTVENFGGLFIITLVIPLLYLLVYAFKSLHSKWIILRTIHNDQISFWLKMTEMAMHFNPRRVGGSMALNGRNNNQAIQDNGHAFSIE